MLRFFYVFVLMFVIFSGAAKASTLVIDGLNDLQTKGQSTARHDAIILKNLEMNDEFDEYFTVDVQWCNSLSYEKCTFPQGYDFSALFSFFNLNTLSFTCCTLSSDHIDSLLRSIPGRLVTVDFLSCSVPADTFGKFSAYRCSLGSI